MALRTSDEETKLNPGDADYRDRFDRIAKAEDDATFKDISDNFDKTADDTTENKNIEKLKNAEEDGGWNNKVSSPATESNTKSKFSLGKRKGPLTAIILTVVGGGFGITALFSPGLLLVQMKEALVGRLNTQLTSMDIRTNKILDSKIKGTTSGICKVVNVACKYSTMSKGQLAKFKAAGIDVKFDKTGVFGNRVRPSAFSVNGGSDISANDFSSKYKTDPAFRSAVKKAYNPKFAGFADKTWGKTATKLGITKAKALPSGNSDAKAKAIDDDVKNGRKPIGALSDVECNSSGCTKTNKDGSKTKLTGNELDEARKAKTATVAALSEAADSSEKLATKAISGSLSSIGETLKVTGYADTACRAYSAVRALGFAAKTVRAVQLARYAMVFLNTADQIKSGSASAEDVAYLGGILTEVAYDAKGAITRKSAMDSFGMQYAMYGTVGKRTSYVSQFMAGGGLTGDLISITNYINDNLFGTPKATCSTLMNGWVQLGSLAAGIALMLVPGVNIALGVSDVVKGTISVGVTVALMVLPDLLKDIVAGTVTQGISGEDAGNAITSGAGTIMSDVAQAGGNAPMTVDDALAYIDTQNSVLAQYAAEDRATLSPLDASNQNTFLGSIVAKILPYSSNVSSVSGSLSMVGSIISKSFSSIIPTSKALSDEEARAALSSCGDPDYANLTGGVDANGVAGPKIATDPFCNPVFGIPTQHLDKDPIQVANELVNSGQIDDLTGLAVPGSDYEGYLNDCINRTRPLGDSGDNFDQDDGSKCLITNPTTANYYLYTIDQRIDQGMDTGGYDDNSTVSGQSNTSIAAPPNTSPRGNGGWTLTRGVDYSSYACDARTTDLGVYNNPRTGYTVRMCAITAFPAVASISLTSTSGSASIVNSLISTNLSNMLEAAKTDGIQMGLSDGMRNTSNPNYTDFSQHSAGLAVDLGAPIGGKTICYASGGFNFANAKACRSQSGIHGDAVRWLDANAKKYGFQNLGGEAWHWSTGEARQEFNP